ncbi:MAG: EI24 domain-containing protein, partial [Myxococcota bacterium]
MSESTRQGLIRTAGFIPGARSVFTGLRLIAADAELRKLTVVPVALTAVLYIAVIALVGVFADDALGWLWPRPGSSWLIPLWYLAWVAGFVAFLLIAALLFSTVAEAVGGPFYERMATRILARH